jgi:hypothetical protein
LLYGTNEGVVELVRHGRATPVHLAIQDVGGEAFNLLLEVGKLTVAARAPAPGGVALALVCPVRVMEDMSGITPTLETSAVISKRHLEP